MRRISLLVPLLLLMLTAAAAAVSAPVIVVTKIEPAIAAIRPGSNTSIEIREPAEELILLDNKGAPFLRMTKDGVFERKSDGKFAEVRKENFFYLHEGHVGAAVLEKQSLPYPWRIAGTYGGKPFVIEGTLVPPGTKAGGSETGGSKLPVAVMIVLAGGLVAVGVVGVVLMIRSFVRR